MTPPPATLPASPTAPTSSSSSSTASSRGVPVLNKRALLSILLVVAMVLVFFNATYTLQRNRQASIESFAATAARPPSILVHHRKNAPKPNAIDPPRLRPTPPPPPPIAVRPANGMPAVIGADDAVGDQHRQHRDSIVDGAQAANANVDGTASLDIENPATPLVVLADEVKSDAALLDPDAPPAIDWDSSYLPPARPMSHEQLQAKRQYYQDASWNFVAYGGGYASEGDTRYSTRATIVIVENDISIIRRVAGSVHFYSWGRRMVIYTTTLSADQLWEIGHIYHAAVFAASASLSDARARSSAIEHANRFFGPGRCLLTSNTGAVIGDCRAGGSIATLLVPPQVAFRRFLCNLDREIQTRVEQMHASNKELALSSLAIGFRANEPCNPERPGQSVCIDGSGYFESAQADPSNQLSAECGLHLRLDRPEPALPRLPNTGKDKFCFCVAAYSNGHDPAAQTVVTEFFSTINTVAPSINDMDFFVYLGTQIDPIWDDPERRSQILEHIDRELGDLDIALRIFRYPLNPKLRDITFKFNALILQAVADGCDYIYQYSDDFRLQNPGWPTRVVNSIKKFDNLAAGGLRDTNNPAIMTLAIAHRSHVERLGYFWAPRFKNWYSDNFMNALYGSRLALSDDDKIFNTQKYGQRYNHCHHQRVWIEEMAKAQHWIAKVLQAEHDELSKHTTLDQKQMKRLMQLPEQIFHMLGERDRSLERLKSPENARAVNQQPFGECLHEHLNTWESVDSLNGPYFGHE